MRWNAILLPALLEFTTGLPVSASGGGFVPLEAVVEESGPGVGVRRFILGGGDSQGDAQLDHSADAPGARVWRIARDSSGRVARFTELGVIVLDPVAAQLLVSFRRQRSVSIRPLARAKCREMLDPVAWRQLVHDRTFSGRPYRATLIGHKMILGHDTTGYLLESLEPPGSTAEIWGSDALQLTLAAKTELETGDDEVQRYQYRVLALDLEEPSPETFKIPEGYRRDEIQPPSGLN